jgi:hypothetical protein
MHCVVICPYCGESIELVLEPDDVGVFTQDCEVCCRPWHVSITGRGAERAVEVRRGDGSE